MSILRLLLVLLAAFAMAGGAEARQTRRGAYFRPRADTGEPLQQLSC